MANGEFVEPVDDSWSGRVDLLSRAFDLDWLEDSRVMDCNSVALIRWRLSKKKKKTRIIFVI